MACADVGKANADIAGIGVVTAFTLQAIASWALSGILEVVLSDPSDHRPQRTIHAVRLPLSLASLRNEIARVEQDLAHIAREVQDKVQQFGQLSTILTTIRGDALRIIWDILETNGSQEINQTLVQENVQERSSRQEARSVVAEILYFSSDAQSLAGIALALTGIVRQSSMSVYQFHLVYDIINLTSISNCAALASASAVDTSDLLSRIVLVVVFGILYLVFVILFGISLGQWDNKVSGRCYDSHYLALPNAQHPYVDQIYLGVTCLYMFSVLILSSTIAISRCEIDPAWGKTRSALANVVIKACRFYNKITNQSFMSKQTTHWADRHGLHSVLWYPFKFQIALTRANPILTAAMFQLPLHLYFIIRLRLSNEPLLSNSSDESEWGFGQVYALVMTAGLVVECFKGSLKYWNAKRHRIHGNQDGANSDDKAESLHGSLDIRVQAPTIPATEGQRREVLGSSR